MYATTRQFLDYFNLKSLDELPALAEIRDLETLNAELGFSESLSDHAVASEDSPGLTVVGGTEYKPPKSQAADGYVTLSEAADGLESRAAQAQIAEQGDVDHDGDFVFSQEDNYPVSESAKPESQG
jgi:segregation and condensation protein B